VEPSLSLKAGYWSEEAVLPVCRSRWTRLYLRPLPGKSRSEAACRQVLCGEQPNRGGCHTPSSAFSSQESPAAKDGHSRDATSASCVPGKEGRDSGDR